MSSRERGPGARRLPAPGGVAYDTDGVARDQELLVGRNDERPEARRVRGDRSARPVLHLTIADRVEAQTQGLEPRADALANDGGVLSDASREHHGRGSAHLREVSADVLPGARA